MSQSNLMEFNGPRTPNEDEWEAVMELVRSIFFPNSPTYREAVGTWPMDLRSEVRENIFAMFHGNRPVSVIGRLERDILVYGHCLRLGFVGGVCTHPDYRKLGLASTTLSATMKRFHENNVDFVCISGDRSMYRLAGARHVGGILRFTLRNGDLTGAVADRVTLMVATADDAKLLATLSQKESIRCIRPISDFEIVLTYSHCVGRSCEFIIAFLDSIPTAYLLITKAMKREDRTFRRVMEYVGDRQTIFTALGKLADDLPEGAELELDVQHGDLLGELLMRANIANQPATVPGTICVPDFARTMTRLKPFFASRWSDELTRSLRFSAGREKYIAWCDDGILEIEGETNMVWTLLGSPPGESISNVRATGAMQELLSGCFPIPLPHLEMNMI